MKKPIEEVPVRRGPEPEEVVNGGGGLGADKPETLKQDDDGKGGKKD